MVHPSTGGSRSQSDIYSQVPGPVCRTGDVRWDGVEATSFIRLAAARPYSAANVEAPDPDIIMRRYATSERTMTPAKTSTSSVYPTAGANTMHVFAEVGLDILDSPNND